MPNLFGSGGLIGRELTYTDSTVYPDAITSTPVSITSVSFLTSVVGTSTNITLPAAAREGDIAVLTYGGSNSGGVAPVAPTGWTTIQTGVLGSTSAMGLFYKALTLSDIASPTVVLPTSTTFANRRILAIFRANGGVTSSNLSVVSSGIESTLANPAPQTISISSVTSPVIALNMMYSSGAVSPRTSSIAMNEIQGASTAHWLRHLSYDSAPQNITVDMDDEGDNILISCGLVISGSGFSYISGNKKNSGIWAGSRKKGSFLGKFQDVFESPKNRFTRSTGLATMPLPLNAVNGSFVVVTHNDDDNPVLAPTGFTQFLANSTGTGNRAGVFYRVLNGSESNIAALSSTGLYNAFVIDGVTSAAQIDRVGSWAVGNTGMPNPPAVTPIDTTSRTRLILALGFLDDDLVAGSVAPPSGYTLAFPDQYGIAEDGATTMVAYKVTTGAGVIEDPGAFTATGGDDANNGLTIIFNNATGIDTTPTNVSGIWNFDFYSPSLNVYPTSTTTFSAVGSFSSVLAAFNNDLISFNSLTSATIPSSFSYPASYSAGDVLVFAFSSRTNAAANNYSITDSLGNTFTRIIEGTQTAGLTVSALFSTTLTSSVTSSNTFTISTTGSTTNGIGVVIYKLSGSTLSLASAQTSQPAVVTTFSQGFTSGQGLAIHVIGTGLASPPTVVSQTFTPSLSFSNASSSAFIAHRNPS